MNGRVTKVLATERRLLRFASREAGTGILLLGVLALGSAFLPVAIAWIAKLILDAVSAGDHARSLNLVALELLAVLGLLACERSFSLWSVKVGSKLNLEARSTILEFTSTQPIESFEDAQFSEKLDRVRKEGPQRVASAVRGCFAGLKGLFSLACCVTLIGGYDFTSLVLLVASVVPAFVTEARVSRMAFSSRKRQLAILRKADYTELVLSTYRLLRDIRAGLAGATLLAQHRSLAAEARAEDVTLAKRRFLMMLGAGFVGNLASYTAYAVLVKHALDQTLSLTDLVLCIAVFRQAQGAIQTALSSLNAYMDDRTYIAEMFDFTVRPRSIPVRSKGKPEASQGIEFVNVSFRHPCTEKPAVSAMSLKLQAQKVTAIIGPIGSGKSTIVRLINGSCKPSHGKVLVGGIATPEWPEEELQSWVATHFQDFGSYLFRAWENIDLARSHGGDSPIVRAAFAQVGLRSDSWPSGADTQLGRAFEGGIELSGGQWQALAIARLFLRQEARCLVLDEPTSSLDMNLEQRVWAELMKLRSSRTIVCVTHRLSIANQADHIIVLNAGQIEDQGSPKELLARRRGFYWELVCKSQLGLEEALSVGTREKANP